MSGGGKMLGEAVLRKFKAAITRTREDKEHGVVLYSKLFTPRKRKGGACFINALPPELLSHIFELGPPALMEDYEECQKTNPPSLFPEFQIHVSHVCRHWRNIAISTPSLWTMIVVDPRSCHQYRLAVTMLERSKSFPIYFVVCDGSKKFNKKLGTLSPAAFTLLSSMLIPHIYRCRILGMYFHEAGHMNAFLSNLSVHTTPTAPNLTKIELHDRDYRPDIGNSRPWMLKYPTLFCGSAPLLTSVVLSRAPVDWTQPWIASASNLKRLYLSSHAEADRPSWAQFASILRGAPSLEKLNLYQSGPSGEPSDWFVESTPGNPANLNGPVHLPRLTVLAITSCSQPYVIGLFRKLCLPSLKHLTLQTFDHDDHTELVQELTGPATSLCPRASTARSRSLLSGLESLHLTFLPCDSGHVELLYGELWNLRSLVLWTADNFFDTLGQPCTLVGRGGAWLPQLEALYVSGVSLKDVRALVQERKKLGAPLRSLYLGRWSPVSKRNRDAAWLRGNVETLGFFYELGGVQLESDRVDFTPL